MKRLIPSSILLVILLFVFWWGNNTVKEECYKTKEELKKCKYAYNMQDYNGAKESAELLRESWENRKNILELLVNHSALDSISELFSQLPHLATEETNTLSISKISQIEYLLDYIMEHQSLSLESLY